MRNPIHLVILLGLALLAPAAANGQGTLADYQRAETLDDRFEDLAVDVIGPVAWLEDATRLWYRKSVRGGYEFVLVDAQTRTKQPAFDHARLATALGIAAGESYTPLTLPFSSLDFVNNGQAIEVDAEGASFRCMLAAYTCTRMAAQAGGGRGGRGGRGAGGGRGGRGGRGGGAPDDDAPPVAVSPDSTFEAFIRNYNIWIRPAGEDDDARQLSYDGSEGQQYSFSSISWSPDSRKVAVYRVAPGYERLVHYIESSPDDQLQPKHSTRSYTKPGDRLDRNQPVIFDVATRRQQSVDPALFPNAYSMSRLDWRDDSRLLTFEYNERGHKAYRVIEVNTETGATRAVIDEQVETFFVYRAASGNLRDNGKKFRYDIDGGREIIWMSERDGWNHLYLYDGATGSVKNQITKGEWVVTAVDSVDTANRQLWFRALAVNPDQDPYFVHYYRIDFDGTGMIAYTEGNGSHTVTWSDDRQFYVDTWSRVDMAPVAVLRRASDQQQVLELERGNVSALVAAGWRAPEVFVAKGRDGTTDIWGIITHPTNFDPSRRYPIIESIYAGPQGSFTAKTFSVNSGHRALAELGFIVVQMDGMGTNNRSKAFHDVAAGNLGDAGFPDRILWHRAVARQYSWYDTTRVGIYGGSAGGQNSTGALLFHPEFYDVAFSSVGCHDNRMDKIWWNELWMGWPLGPHYEASSNVVNAHRLQGKLLLVVGELDTNVDPSSTMQVVNALIEADKYFDLLVIPGAGHGSGGAYGSLKRNDFFVKHLLGVEPPDWNVVDLQADGDDDFEEEIPQDDFFMNPYIGPDHPLSWLDGGPAFGPRRAAASGLR
jgi:dipeptidyl aminopeptidase/acylaminoacyl peptidase